MSDSQQTIDRDKKRFAMVFKHEVVPILEKKLLPGAKIFSLEDKKGKLPLLLDRQHGTDALILAGQSLCGLSSRVQECGEKSAFDTFSIRKEKSNGAKTELEKRHMELSKGEYSPEYCVQAFLHDSDKISIGVCRTNELVKFAKKHGKEKTNRNDGTQFLSCSWSEMQRNGLFLKTFTGQRENKKSD